MVTGIDIEERFPELRTAGADLISEKLASAVAMLNASSWGALYDEGIYLLTASLLASSPWGQDARMVSERGTSVYSVAFDRLELSIDRGPFVI